MLDNGLPVEIFIKDLPAGSQEETLTALADALEEQKVVKSSFSGAVLERETQYPTGLLFPSGGVAIPHTDAHHCLRPAVALGILSEPIEFEVMGGSAGEQVPVKIVVMLSITNSQDQAPVLAALMQSLSQDGKLDELSAASSAAEAETVLWISNQEQAPDERVDSGSWAATQEVVVGPRAGLHARPASLFVKKSKEFKADIEVVKEGRRANAKSSLKIMSLGAKKDDRVTIQAQGEDAEEAVQILADLISAEE